MKKAIKDLKAGERFIFDEQKFLVHNRYAGRKLNVQCLLEDGTFNLFADGEIVVEVIEEDKKEIIEFGDKIDVICRNGHGSTVGVYLNGVMLYGVENISLDILPNEQVRAKLKVCSVKVASDAVISEISVKQYNSDKIKDIIDKLPDPNNWSGPDKRDKAYEAIFNIIDILYPNGDRVLPE